MTRKLSRREAVARQNRQGVLILAVSVLSFFGVAGYVLLNQPAARDRVTGCLKGQLAVDIVAVIDRTDEYSRTTQALLGASLESLAGSVPVEGRLTLYAFDGGGDEIPRPVLQRCRPVGGDGVNPLIATPARADRLLATAFTLPVAEKIGELTTLKSSPETHLVAYLATLGGVMNYRKQAGRRVVRIYGDMAENHGVATLIGKRAMEPKAFAAYAKDKIGWRLKGIEIEVVQVPSTSTPPGVARAIKAAWVQVFTELGVSYTWSTL